jgi:signal transduction histidine kinase
MVVPGRHKSIAFFIALGVGLIAVTLLLYIGWVVLNWRTGILVFFGVLLLAMIISGVVLNTTFLVREIRRNEQHDAFINAVTHELKTPVASIRLYLETLLRRQVDEEKRLDFYRTMLDDSDRLLVAIDQILRTGRLSRGNRLMNPVTVDFNALVEECVQRARTLHSLPEDAIQYRSGQTLTLQGDPDELRAAASNMINNAVKYSAGEVKVAVETSRLDDKFALLRVKDRGVGIPNQELKRIFKRFYRVPGPVAVRLKGTGLGLYIVRSVATRHGGRVWAESAGLGHGSTFVLQLPISK